ncbi:MAG: hypothetical protein P9F75_05565 [Candidatus Contendobacter sp.]|nr:hypothetical protein [Candidatus Contendobacter sp.]
MILNQTDLSANTLHLRTVVKGSSIDFHYDIDGRFVDLLSITYPFDLTATDHVALGAMGLAVSIFLGQLCRARRIHLGFSVSSSMIEQIMPLAEMLYDIRCWKDGIDLVPPPDIECDTIATPELEFIQPTPRRACLLFSGGKDSSLSAIVLRNNNWDVRALHIPANAYVFDAERKAVSAIGERLSLKTETLNLSFPGFALLSRAYATTWDHFPHHNAVPFGRDLLLAVLACPMARHQRVAALCMGHDHNCRIAQITHLGKRIARNDVESADGATLLAAYIQRFLCPGLALLPPVAMLTEYRILREMFLNHPDLMALTSFCFWGNYCGRCSKCLRYYLVERVLGCEGMLRFAMSPLDGETSPELGDYFAVDWDSDALFSGEVAYCLARLVQRGDIRAGEARLRQFAETIFPKLAPNLDAIEENLMRIYPDPQVPSDFVL